MNTHDFFLKWYQTFAFNVSQDIFTNHVTSIGNHPWHIFTWGEVKAVEGEEAVSQLREKKFNAVLVFTGYPDHYSKIKIIKSQRKLLKLINTTDDIYLTSKDFSWTFVKTHESQCGPYFRERESNTVMNLNIDGNLDYYMNIEQGEKCDCNTCKNYYAKIKGDYPDLDRYFSEMGVNIEKPFEAVSLSDEEDTNGMMEYFAWYIVKGDCGLDYEIKINNLKIIKAVDYPNPCLQDDYFVLVVYNIKLPYKHPIEVKKN